jgi:hypothetical protein
MSERLKNLIGDELYSKIEEKIKDNKDVKLKDIDIISGNFVTKTRFDEINSENKTLKEKSTTYEKQLKETKKLLEGSEEFKTKYEELNTKYQDEISSKDKEILNIKKNTKIKDFLKENGAKYPELLMKDINIDSISYENDKLNGVTDVLKDLKGKYSDQFITKKDNSTPPKNNSNKDDDGGSDKFGEFGRLVDISGGL